MDGKLLLSLGRVAGISGICIGVIAVIYLALLAKQPGLESAQAFAVYILTFGIAGIGIIAGGLPRRSAPKNQCPAQLWARWRRSLRSLLLLPPLFTLAPKPKKSQLNV